MTPTAEPSSTWLVTGAAGFIGSHLVERLLRAGHRVVGMDNFFSGRLTNLQAVADSVGAEIWDRFSLLEGDIRSEEDCEDAVDGVQHVLHQAAIASVQYSLHKPDEAYEVNVSGFETLVQAASQAGVKSLVFASSCAIYGDEPTLPKSESSVIRPLSPYAETKYSNEIYSKAFTDENPDGMRISGLRYFNVFGPRQDPKGEYAAVIAKWATMLISGKAGVIYGTGEQTRDFVYVTDVAAANVSAALSPFSGIYNIGSGQSVSVRQLYDLVVKAVIELTGNTPPLEPIFEPARTGEVPKSQALVSLAREKLGFEAQTQLQQGIRQTLSSLLQSSSEDTGT